MVTGAAGGEGPEGPSGTGSVDFFVSYTAADRAWAEWAAWLLEDAGYTTRVQAWDFGPGTHFVAEMHRAAQQALRTIAVLSAAYLDSAYAREEWQAAWAGDPAGERRSLLAVRVEDCDQPGLLRQLVPVDLFGVGEDTARQRLLAAAEGERGRPATAPAFPGAAATAGGPTPGPAPVFPGRLPVVFHVPPRLRHFTGRRALLDQMRAVLAGGTPVAVTALHGLGGVGKTQLAVEYAHRHAAEFELVWWIEAEQAALFAEQLAALAPHLGLPATGQVPDDAASVLDALRRREGWLLVFDNAESPAALQPWLPGGPGQTLITSRNPAWGGLAGRLEVDVLPRPEALALLGRRIPGLDPATAGALAAELGDLPLALEQAAAYLEATALPPAGYLEKFRTRRAQMLARGHDLAHGGNLDTVWSLALDRFRTQAPAAVALLDLCAHLGPEPIPLALVRDHPDRLDPPLRDTVAGTSPAGDLDDTLGAVLAYSLARRNQDTLQLHRLVAAAIRAHQPPALHAKAAATVRALLAAHPGDYLDPAGWPRWAALAPQVLTAPALHPDDPAADIGDDARWLLVATAYYLHARGDFRAAGALGHTLHTRWAAALGPDHPHSLAAASVVADAHRSGGDYQAARSLSEDTLTRMRRVLGDDHPQTLSTAAILAFALANLGESPAARDLAEDTLARRRRILGDDHPDTLASAHNLAEDVRQLGKHRSAREDDRSSLRRAGARTRQAPGVLGAGLSSGEDGGR